MAAALNHDISLRVNAAFTEWIVSTSILNQNRHGSGESERLMYDNFATAMEELSKPIFDGAAM
jgi:hypothetical protein